MIKRLGLVALIGLVFCLGLMAGATLQTPPAANAFTSCMNEIQIINCNKGAPDAYGHIPVGLQLKSARPLTEITYYGFDASGVITLNFMTK